MEGFKYGFWADQESRAGLRRRHEPLPAGDDLLLGFHVSYETDPLLGGQSENVH